MANLQEIQSRMFSTMKTSHITKAMSMVSVSKLHQADVKLKAFMPYISKLQEMVNRIIINDDLETKHAFLEHREIKKACYVVVTSERGLAGAFNSNILRTVYRQIQKNHQDQSTYEVITIGRAGRNFFRSQGIDILYEITNLSDRFTFHTVHKHFLDIIQFFIDGKVDTLQLYYNHFISAITQEVRVEKLLPIQPFVENLPARKQYEYDFDPSAKDILNVLLIQYVEALLFEALLDSKASEHAARMTAMKNATDNAEELISDLAIAYNRIRQSTITQEITEIVGGATAINS